MSTAVLEIMPVDAAIVVAEFLARPGTNLYNLVESRVYPEEIPQTETYDEPLLCVREPGGSLPERNIPMENARIEIKCYGGDHRVDLAKQVARLVFWEMTRIRDVATASGRILSAYREGGADSVIWTPVGVRAYIPVFYRALVKPLED